MILTRDTSSGASYRLRLLHLIAIAVCVQAGLLGTRVGVALYAIHLGATPLMVGVLLALYYVLSALFAVPLGRLTDRIGPRLPFAIISVAWAMAILAPSLFPSLAALAVSALVTGLSHNSFQIGLYGLAGKLRPPALRGADLGWVSLGFSIGGAVGPVAIGWTIDNVGYGAAFALFAGMMGITFLLVVGGWRLLPGPPTAQQAAGRQLRDLFMHRPLRAVFVSVFFLSFSWNIYNFGLPIHGTSAGLSATTIGLILTWFSVASAAVRLVLPLVMGRMRDWRLMGLTYLVAAATLLAVPLFFSTGPLIAVSVLFGIAVGINTPLVYVLYFNASPEGRQTEAMGAGSIVSNAAHISTPLAAGALGAAFGIGPVLSLAGVIMLAAGWRTWRQA